MIQVGDPGEEIARTGHVGSEQSLDSGRDRAKAFREKSRSCSDQWEPVAQLQRAKTRMSKSFRKPQALGGFCIFPQFSFGSVCASLGFFSPFFWGGRPRAHLGGSLS